MRSPRLGAPRPGPALDAGVWGRKEGAGIHFPWWCPWFGLSVSLMSLLLGCPQVSRSLWAGTCVCVCVNLYAHCSRSSAALLCLGVFVHVCTRMPVYMCLSVCGGVRPSSIVSSVAWPTSPCASVGASASVSASVLSVSATPCVSVYLCVCVRESLRVCVDAAF